MTKMPKHPPYRNENYLNFIRSKPCLVCGNRAEAHHVRRSFWGSGASQRPHDYVALPLCPAHHNLLVEEQTDCERAIIDLLIQYIESKRRGKNGKQDNPDLGG